MNQTEVKENIIRLLENISRRTQMLDEKNKNLELDIDLIRDDLRALYRQYEKLLITNREVPPGRQTPAASPAPENPVTPVAPPTPENPEKQVKAEEPAEKPSAPEKPAEKTKKTVPAARESVSGSGKTVLDLLSSLDNHTIADRYTKAEDDSLHNRISSGNEDRSIGARMQQHPINSLRDVIGVNEKFLFINELFQGNIQAYNDAIAKLNDMEGIRAAFDYLNELGSAFEWDARRSSTTIEKLANYVQRRHMNQ